MSQIKKLINQKFLEGIDSTKFHVAQNGAIMAKDSSGAMVEFLKVNSDNKGVVLGKVISTKNELDLVIADLAQEVLDRQAGDVSTLNSARSYTDQKITDLVNGAPQLLDTLKELADAIGNDENFAVSVANQVAAVQAALNAEIARAQAAETALSGRMTTAEGDIDALEGRMSTAEGDIDAVEVRMTSAEGRLSTVEPKVATLEGEMDQAQVDIGALKTRMTTAESDIDALEVEMGLAKGRLDVLEDDMQSAQQDINSLFTDKADTSYVNSQLTIKLQEAKDYADSQDEIVLDDAKSYADAQDAVKLIEAKSYADTKDAEKLLEAKQYAVEQDALKLAEAKAYTDSEMADEVFAREQGDINTLASAKSYTDAEVLIEKNRAMGIESGLRFDLNKEVQDRIDAVAAEALARDAAILVEKNRAEGAEAGLQSAIDVEKGRVDAILSASTADKDSFAEIVSLINSVDLENDNALASVILAEQNARKDADDALDARLDIVEPKVSSLETRMNTAEGDIDAVEVRMSSAEGEINGLKTRMTSAESSISNLSSNKADKSYVDSQDAGLQGQIDGLDGRLDIIEGADSVEGSVAKAEKDAKDYADSKFAMAQSSLDDLEGYALDIRGDLNNEIDRAEAAEGALDGRLDVLEAMAFYKESKQVGSGDFSFVELAREAKPNSIKAYVGRLALHEGQDFSVSVVGGKSRLTWMGDFMVGGPEEIEEGMKLFFEYYC
jgi:predicted  nucleic acid-binding Zn-ribbon protein